MSIFSGEQTPVWLSYAPYKVADPTVQVCLANACSSTLQDSKLHKHSHQPNISSVLVTSPPQKKNYNRQQNTLLMEPPPQPALCETPNISSVLVTSPPQKKAYNRQQNTLLMEPPPPPPPQPALCETNYFAGNGSLWLSEVLITYRDWVVIVVS